MSNPVLNNKKIDARLFVSNGCVHCATMEKTLAKLHSEGLVNSVEIINVSNQPDKIQAFGIKSVPYLKMAQFEFTGSVKESELRIWIQRLDDNAGLGDYVGHLLLNNELDSVLKLINQQPNVLSDVLALAAEPAKALKMQLGISAIVEEFAGSIVLLEHLDSLISLAQSDDAIVRADAAHFLSLTRHVNARPMLTRLSRDVDKQVCEIALDGLSELPEE